MVNIYVIENNVNDKLYVGRTSQTLNKRMKSHRANANRYLKNPSVKCLPFQKEMAKLGIKNFRIKLLEVCDDNVANEREVFWTKELNTLEPNGYNCNRGNDQLSKRLDLIGKSFGKLTVVKFAYLKNNNTYWECKCACGNTTIVRGSKLLNGHTQSCGCICRENTSKSNHNRCLHCYIDDKYVNLKDFCRNNGISYAMVRQRVRKLNYTITDALSKPSKKCGYLGIEKCRIKEVV